MGRDDLDEGFQLGGRWEIGRALGRGAFGTVWAVVDRSAVQLGGGAAKVLDSAPRSREEIHALAALRHDHLVAYYDSGQLDDGSWWVVTEQCDASLADVLEAHGIFDATATQKVVADVAAGLAYLHQHDRVHRDIKPGNILLRGSRWKIADLGLVRSTDSSRLDLVTQGGTRDAGGSLAYMAPEAFDSDHVTKAVDIYALGVIVHELLTGKRLHSGSTAVALVASVLANDGVIDPSLEPGWEQLIRDCCQREPERRPRAPAVARTTAALTRTAGRTDAAPTVDRATLALAPPPTATSALDFGPVPTPTLETGTQPRRRRWLLPAVLLGLAATLGALGVVWADRDGSPDSAASAEDPDPGASEATEGSQTTSNTEPQATTSSQPSPSTTTITATTTSLDTVTEPPLGTFITVLQSLPTANFSETDALASRDAWRSRGTTVNVLLSDAFASLRPGYWVVYGGPFATAAESTNRCRELGLPMADACYGRRISQDPADLDQVYAE